MSKTLVEKSLESEQFPLTPDAAKNIFDHYAYLVPKYIEMYCPEMADNEDFMQEVYLNFFGFIRANENFALWIVEKNCYHKIGNRLHTWFRQHLKTMCKHWKDEEIALTQTYIPLEEDVAYYDEPEVYYHLLQDNLAKVIDFLTDREQEVLMHRFGFGPHAEHTLTETASYFGVTKERIRQIENKAVRKLRHPARTKFLKDYYCYTSTSEWSLPNALTAPLACVARKQERAKEIPKKKEIGYEALTSFLLNYPENTISFTFDELEELIPLKPVMKWYLYA